FRGTRFTNAHETLIWCSKGPDARNITLSYDAVKVRNDDVQMRSDWHRPICSGGERLKVEGEKAHTTQKPEALLYRVLTAASNPGDVVLDPFFGTGTTGAVARKLGRHFIGLEREEKYIAVALDRLRKVRQMSEKDLEITRGKRQEPRIPFGSVVERGLLSAGQVLFDARKRYRARVRADGSLVASDVSGSIHKVGAQLQGASSCNGWTFWHFDVEGKAVSIDVLRQQVRAEMN